MLEISKVKVKLNLTGSSGGSESGYLFATSEVAFSVVTLFYHIHDMKFNPDIDTSSVLITVLMGGGLLYLAGIIFKRRNI